MDRRVAEHHARLTCALVLTGQLGVLIHGRLQLLLQVRHLATEFGVFGLGTHGRRRRDIGGGKAALLQGLLLNCNRPCRLLEIHDVEDQAADDGS